MVQNIDNLILRTDSYKPSHFHQYNPSMKRASFYIEPRWSGPTAHGIKEVVHFGLQMYLKSLKPITAADIDEAEDVIVSTGEPFNRAGWEHIVNRHGGYLPLMIQAPDEGTVLPLQNVQVQVMNTDPEVPWLPSYIETDLLRAVWYPSTVAAISRDAKKVIYGFLKRTCDDPEAVLPFRLHDFGARGCTSSNQAQIGGLAHLVNFMGTDTVEALVAARRYYGSKMAGFSIPAAEHSTIMSWPHEALAFNRAVDKFSKAGSLYAVVSDTYDIMNAVNFIWGYQLIDKVKASGGTLVVRPDSGDPVQIVTNVIQALADKFGYTVNSKGFKVLHPSVRVIQGDGINNGSIYSILFNLLNHGFSAENVAFGMGGALLQRLDRDTFGYAMKMSAIDTGDGWVGVFKHPVTDTKKKSKKGRLTLVNSRNTIVTLEEGSEWTDADPICLLNRVFENGEILKSYTLDEVRANASI